MMIALTDRQQSVLDYVKGFISAKGFPPTRRQINEQFGFTSPNAAQRLLIALAAKGFITLSNSTARGIKVNE